MPLIIAASDCMVLLYTTGRYCLHSSLVKPLSWMILRERERERKEGGRREGGREG